MCNMCAVSVCEEKCVLYLCVLMCVWEENMCVVSVCCVCVCGRTCVLCV